MYDRLSPVVVHVERKGVFVHKYSLGLVGHLDMDGRGRLAVPSTLDQFRFRTEVNSSQPQSTMYASSKAVHLGSRTIDCSDNCESNCVGVSSTRRA